jgi:hypothetical protein
VAKIDADSEKLKILLLAIRRACLMIASAIAKYLGIEEKDKAA